MNDGTDLDATITRRRVLAAVGTLLTVMIAAGIGLSRWSGVTVPCRDATPDRVSTRSGAEERGNDTVDDRTTGDDTEW